MYEERTKEQQTEVRANVELREELRSAYDQYADSRTRIEEVLGRKNTTLDETELLATQEARDEAEAVRRSLADDGQNLA